MPSPLFGNIFSLASSATNPQHQRPRLRRQRQRTYVKERTTACTTTTTTARRRRRRSGCGGVAGRLLLCRGRGDQAHAVDSRASATLLEGGARAHALPGGGGALAACMIKIRRARSGRCTAHFELRLREDFHEIARNSRAVTIRAARHRQLNRYVRPMQTLVRAGGGSGGGGGHTRVFPPVGRSVGRRGGAKCSYLPQVYVSPEGRKEAAAAVAGAGAGGLF